MLRILHIGKFFPPFAGGMENFLADLMLAQAKQGNTVAALVHNHQSSTEEHGPLIYRVPCYGRLLYAPISPHFPFWLHRVIKEFQPQILHLHLPNTSAFWALGLPKKIPWVIHWHADVLSELNSRLSLAYPLYRPFEQWSLARAAAVIVTSPPYLSSSQALRRWQAKCQVIPLGLALERLPEPSLQAQQWAAQQWGQQPGLKILSVGRLTYYKGHEVLIQAMQKVEKGQLIIVGEGELYQSLKELIRTLKLSSKVKLIGSCGQEELIGLLATCDVFCLPSLERTEAFGVVLLEAMRYAKPIIASAIAGSGVMWVVENIGILVPVGDVTAWVAALSKVLKEPPWRMQSGELGRQRLLQEFDIALVAEKISKVYQEVLKKNRIA